MADNTAMKKISQRILRVCVVITLVFIWANSLLPGDVSSLESGWAEKLLWPVLDRIYDGTLQSWVEALAGILPGRLGLAVFRFAGQLGERLPYIWPSVLVRKAAHFTEYAVLGFFMGLLWVRRDGRSRFLLPEALCLTAACVDESIQLFVSGRAGQLRDVCIDLSGATLGVLVALTLLSAVRFWYVRRREAGKNP